MPIENPPESPAPAGGSQPFPYQKVAARTLAAAGIGATVLIFLSLIGAAIYQSSYTGRIYPGVSISGLDLSGLTAADAARQLVGGYTYLRDGKIVFQFEDKTWVASPADLGLNVNYLVSVDDAYAVGRSGGILESFVGQYQARFFGVSVSPVLQYDGGRAMAYLQNIAAQVDRPPQEAKITLSGLDVAAQARRNRPPARHGIHAFIGRGADRTPHRRRHPGDRP